MQHRGEYRQGGGQSGSTRPGSYRTGGARPAGARSTGSRPTGSRPGDSQRGDGREASGRRSDTVAPVSADERRAQRRASKDAAEAKARREKKREKAQSRQTGVPGAEVPRKHAPELAVRPFSPVDFSQIVHLLPPERVFLGMSETETEAQAQMVMGMALASSSIALVATVDDGTGYDPDTVGFLAAAVPGQPPITGAQTWREAGLDAQKTLRYGCPQARLAHAYETQAADRAELLFSAASVSRVESAELLVLAVDPRAEALGASDALLAKLERRLGELDVHDYVLQADSAVPHQRYIDHGFTCLADIELDSECPMPPGDPVDPVDPVDPASHPHALLLRKSL